MAITQTKKDDRKLSVCMATRNGEKYIKRQLETILVQLSQDDEVIISDDSSTDGTVDIIKGFHDSRIMLLENNRFYSPIFNVENALKRASGGIIVLADQDDIWMENKISVIRREMAGIHEGIHLVVLDGQIVNEKEEALYNSINAFNRAGNGICKNIYDNTYLGCNMAFTRELLKVALPFPKKIPMHDMWLGLLAELFGSATFVEDKVFKWRRHETSLTIIHRRLDLPRQIMRRYHLVASLLGRSLYAMFRGKPLGK